MNLKILLFILVAESICQPIEDHEKNSRTDGNNAEDIGENARSLNFGERLSVRKGSSGSNRNSHGKIPSGQNNGEDIRSKRGHLDKVPQNTDHFVIRGHDYSDIKPSIGSSGHHNNHRVSGAVTKASLYKHNEHGIVIPVLGPSSIQASTSPGPLIKFGSATLTRINQRQQPSGFTNRKQHFTHSDRSHNAAPGGIKSANFSHSSFKTVPGTKRPATIKQLSSSVGSHPSLKSDGSDVYRKVLSNGYEKYGLHHKPDGYTPGTGFYYG
ncbi:unnamed protein product [Meganyctiphanes norvegica]|uniref:Uncharacterized protein n=1 Tax=Meganyctiphanes norvegica TaxID=48144 RepID=A0AAV2QI16_MEGNR